MGSGLGADYVSALEISLDMKPCLVTLAEQASDSEGWGCVAGNAPIRRVWMRASKMRLNLLLRIPIFAGKTRESGARQSASIYIFKLWPCIAWRLFDCLRYQVSCNQ